MAYRRRILTLLVALVIVSAFGVAPASAQDNRAAIVVQFGSGYRVVRIVRFNTPTITGMQLLERSGIGASIQGGLLVCRIGPDGCAVPQEECFCGAPYYWSYFNWAPAGWRFTCSGAADHLVANGDADGWIWGNSVVPYFEDKAGLFDETRLAPGLPQVRVDPAGALHVTMDIAGDSDRDGSVGARVRPLGGVWGETQQLQRSGDQVALSLPSLQTGHYELEIVCSDGDGVNGSPTWRSPVHIAPTWTAFLPSVSLAMKP